MIVPFYTKDWSQTIPADKRNVNEVSYREHSSKLAQQWKDVVAQNV